MQRGLFRCPRRPKGPQVRRLDDGRAKSGQQMSARSAEGMVHGQCQGFAASPLQGEARIAQLGRSLFRPKRGELSRGVQRRPCST
eukprot:6078081-Pyramimonas_sp.AAC.1